MAPSAPNGSDTSCDICIAHAHHRLNFPSFQGDLSLSLIPYEIRTHYCNAICRTTSLVASEAARTNGLSMMSPAVESTGSPEVDQVD